MVAASHTRLCLALKGSRLTNWPAPVPMRLTHRTVQVISNGDLLCFRNKGSCRRSFDARSQSVAFGEYSTGLSILASTLSEKFVEMKLWTWSDAESSYEAPRQTCWIHCRDMGSQTMQVMSNGGLLCFGNMGLCRRSFDALVCRRTHSAMSSWPSLLTALKGSRLTGWLASVPMRLTHRTMQVISNGDLLCFHNKGSCRRSFDASSRSVAFGEYSSLSGSDHTKPARSQVRGDVVNHTIPNKMQRTHYSWCEGWWPIRRVIGKRPLSSAVNMTRAEAMRNNSY